MEEIKTLVIPRREITQEVLQSLVLATFQAQSLTIPGQLGYWRVISVDIEGEFVSIQAHSDERDDDNSAATSH